MGEQTLTLEGTGSVSKALEFWPELDWTPEMTGDARADALRKKKRRTQLLFLLHYAACGGNTTKAALEVGISPRTPNKWKETKEGSPLDKPYAEAFAVADQMAADIVEAEAYRRATEGTLTKDLAEQIDDEGRRTGRLIPVRKVSDQLLLRILERKKPEYRQQQTHKVEGEVAHSHEHKHAHVLIKLPPNGRETEHDAAIEGEAEEK